MTEKDLSQKIDWSITSLYTKVAIGLLITTTILPLTVKGFSEILNKIWHFNEPGSPSIQFGDQPIVIGEGARVNENESCVFMPTVDLSNDGEWIYYSLRSNLQRYNILNSTIEELSNPNIQFLGGKLSPDNKFFVYKGGKEDFKQSTWLLNINTKEHREVSGFGFIYGWTPEGSVLLSGSERRRFSIDDILFEATGIDILDPVNGLRLSFIEGVYGAREPKYSPDGSVIAYLNTVSIIKKPEDFLEFHEDIFIADKKGKDLYRLTEGMSVKHIVWSPDGNHILFTTEEKEMYTINIDGTGLRLIGNDLYDFPPPVWTTENQIIYHSGRESKEYDTADIYAFNPVTNTEHLVIGGDGIQQAWELNGNIAVVRDMPSDGDCEAQILINLISGATHNLYYQMQDTPK